MSPDVAKIVIVVLEACAGHLGPPPPKWPIGNQDRHCAVDPPNSAAFQQGFLIFGPNIAVQVVKIVLKRRYVYLAGNPF